MRSLRVGADLVCLVLLTACGPVSSGAASSTFPQHVGFGDSGPAGLLAGRLVSDAGCLMLEVGDPGGRRTLLVWPDSYRPVPDGQGVQGDAVVIHVGDEVVLGGGEYTDEAWVSERLVGPAISAECRTGQYGLVTSIVSTTR